MSSLAATTTGGGYSYGELFTTTSVRIKPEPSQSRARDAEPQKVDRIAYEIQSVMVRSTADRHLAYNQIGFSASLFGLALGFFANIQLLTLASVPFILGFAEMIITIKYAQHRRKQKN